jgi:hypothetical protein
MKMYKLKKAIQEETFHVFNRLKYITETVSKSNNIDNSMCEKSISEESATGAIGVGAGPISTPKWVMPKNKKENPSTKAMKKLGFKKVVTELVKKELNSYNKK